MFTVILYLLPPTSASTMVTLFGGSGIVNFDTSRVHVPTSRLTEAANAGTIPINNVTKPEMIEAVRDMTALLIGRLQRMTVRSMLTGVPEWQLWARRRKLRILNHIENYRHRGEVLSAYAGDRNVEVHHVFADPEFLVKGNRRVVAVIRLHVYHPCTALR